MSSLTREYYSLQLFKKKKKKWRLGQKHYVVLSLDSNDSINYIRGKLQLITILI